MFKIVYTQRMIVLRQNLTDTVILNEHHILNAKNRVQFNIIKDS